MHKSPKSKDEWPLRDTEPIRQKNFGICRYTKAIQQKKYSLCVKQKEKNRKNSLFVHTQNYKIDKIIPFV